MVGKISFWHADKLLHVNANKAGKILAGAAVTQVHRIPATMRWLNKLVKFVPPDGNLKQLSMDKIWFEPEQQKAAQFFWETFCWE